MMGTAENISDLRSFLSIVAEETGALIMDDADEESVGWTTEGPLPMTFGHVRRAHVALAVLEAALSTDAEPVIYVSRKSLEELLEAKGSHVALQTLIHRKPLKSGNGVPLYAEPVKTAPAVAVKELRWKGPDSSGEYHSLDGLWGYIIRAGNGNGFWLTEIGDYFPSPEAAQAAAQADYEARIRSALSAQVQDVTSWRPIETAPKDGTPILGGHSEAVLTVWWEADGSQNNSGEPGWIDGSFNSVEENYTYPVTHWMPLPAAPAKQEGGHD